MIDPQAIREHMDVVDDNGDKIGSVDRVEGQQLKLTRASGGGEHRYIPLADIERVDRHVHLKRAVYGSEPGNAPR